MRTLLCLFALVAAALAQDVESVSPACGAPGDRLLITGSGFGDEPVVTIGATEVEVLKSDATRTSRCV